MDYSELKSKWGRKSRGNNSNAKLIAGLVVVVVVVGAFYFLSGGKFILSGAEKTLKVNVVIGNVTKFTVNGSCISSIIPYFVDVKLGERKVSNATVNVALLSSSRKEMENIDLFYDPSIQSWKTAVGYTCLEPGKYSAFAYTSIVVDGKKLNATGESAVFELR